MARVILDQSILYHLIRAYYCDVLISHDTRRILDRRSTRNIYHHDKIHSYHLYACPWFIADRSVALAETIYKTSHDVFAKYAREIRSGPEQREWHLTAIAFKTATSTPWNNICRTRTKGRIAVSGYERLHGGREILTSGRGDLRPHSRGSRVSNAIL